MTRLLAAVVSLVILTALAGCGSSIGDAYSRATAAEVPHTSTCGANGYRIKLYKVDCETVNAMVAMLNGRAYHQTLTLAWEQGHRVTWTCNSPTHSLTDRLHCSQGVRFFTIYPTSG